jgi:Tfp pilus assembly protein PilX
VFVVVHRLIAGALARSRARGDRGDVNGYVLVTVMTAGLVMALWTVARGRLAEVFDHAITSVMGG